MTNSTSFLEAQIVYYTEFPTDLVSNLYHHVLRLRKSKGTADLQKGLSSLLSIESTKQLYEHSHSTRSTWQALRVAALNQNLKVSKSKTVFKATASPLFFVHDNKTDPAQLEEMVLQSIAGNYKHSENPKFDWLVQDAGRCNSNKEMFIERRLTKAWLTLCFPDTPNACILTGKELTKRLVYELVAGAATLSLKTDPEFAHLLSPSRFISQLPPKHRVLKHYMKTVNLTSSFSTN